MRSLVSALCVAVATITTSAFAGPAYAPPKVGPAKVIEAPEDLRADATELLKAVTARDVAAMERWLAPRITTISGAIDLAYPRVEKLEDTRKTIVGQVAQLGQSTGGDWDIPPDADIGAFLTDMELTFIAQSLTDGQAWGTDPIVKGAICTYALGSYDPAEVKRVAKRLGVEGGSFVAVRKETEILDTAEAGAKSIGQFKPGLLYALDYGTDTPTGWSALHLPGGGIGFTAALGDDFDKPYASGLCFKQQESGDWQVVAQTSTGL